MKIAIVKQDNELFIKINNTFYGNRKPVDVNMVQIMNIASVPDLAFPKTVEIPAPTIEDLQQRPGGPESNVQPGEVGTGSAEGLANPGELGTTEGYVASTSGNDIPAPSPEPEPAQPSPEPEGLTDAEKAMEQDTKPTVAE